MKLKKSIEISGEYKLLHRVPKKDIINFSNFVISIIYN